VRWNMNTDTPLPPDEPTAPNPPEGAIIDYYLKTAATGPITIEITGADGKLVRRYSSEDQLFKPDVTTTTIPLYWYRTLTALSKQAGMHRFTWDLHYQPLDQLTGPGKLGGAALPIAAVGHNTVPSPTTPWVNPETFTVKLTVDGKSFTQPLTVKLDPRVKTAAATLQQIYTLSYAMYYGAVDAQQAEQQAKNVRDQIARIKSQATGAAADTLTAADGKLERIAGALQGLARVMSSLTEADVRPTTIQLNARSRARTAAAEAIAAWNTAKAVDLAAANAALKAAGLPTLSW